VVIHGLCQYLHESLGDNFMFATTDDMEPSCPWRMESLPSVGSTTKIINVLLHSFLFRRRSLQEAVFRSKQLGEALLHAIQSFSPTIVLFDTVRLGQYLPPAPRSYTSVIYLDDLFSLRYERMLESAKKGGNALPSPLGNFRKNLPKSVVPIFERHDGVMRWLLEFETKLVRQSEDRQASLADISLLINRDEVELLRKRVPDSAVKECPPLVEQQEPLRRNWNGAPTFLFLGALNLAHNETAVENLLKTVFPAFLLRYPAATLFIVGRGAPSSLQELAEKFGDRVVMMGFIPDLRAVLASSCALVAPLVFGSGVKIKMIEALAASLPILATPIGAEGINVTDGENAFVTASLGDFPDRMEQLLDPDVNNRISLASRRLYEEEYAKEQVFARYHEVFNTRGETLGN